MGDNFPNSSDFPQSNLNPLQVTVLHAAVTGGANTEPHLSMVKM